MGKKIYPETKLGGFTAKEIAKEASVSESAVYYWCRGKGKYVAAMIEGAIKRLLAAKENEELEL